MEILRIILITFGSIAGFFVFAVMLFLFFPIKTEIVYGESKFVRIRFLFFRYNFTSGKVKTLVRKKKRAGHKATEKSEEDGASAEPEKDIEKKAASESEKTDKKEKISLDDIFTIADAIINKFVKKLYFNLVSLDITAASSQADKTAILYGRLNAGIYPLLGMIDSAGRLGKSDVNIVPDFTSEKFSAKVHIMISTRLVYILNCFLYLKKEKII